MGKENRERQLVGRLHRLEGQVRSLERVLAADDPQQAVTQFEAIIAAAKSALVLYLETLESAGVDEVTRRKIYNQAIKKLG